MKIDCLKRFSQTTFICILTGVIVYEAFAGEHHDHLPHKDFDTIPTFTITTTAGTSNASTSTTTTL